MPQYYIHPTSLASKLTALTRDPVSTDSGIVVRPQFGDAHLTSFDEIVVAESQCDVSLSFQYSVLNTRLYTTTLVGSGAVTYSAPFAVLSTGAAINSSASVQSRAYLRYIPGQSNLSRFTAIFSTGVAGSQQEQGVGDDNDGFFFGYQGTTFGVFIRTSVTGSPVDTFVPQASWNGDDPMDGTGPSGVTLDPTKLNLYTIRYGWLGGAGPKFFVHLPGTSESILVHEHQTLNAGTTTTTRYHSLPLRAKVTNTTNATAIVLSTPSMAGIHEGKEALDGQETPNSVASAAVSGIGTAGATLLTLRNDATNVLGGTNINHAGVRLMNLSCTVQTGDARIALVLNPTLGGAPSFAKVSANTSLCSVDTAGTLGSGGHVVRSFVASAQAGVLNVSLAEEHLFMYPGETVSIQVFANSGTITSRASLSYDDLL